MMDESFYFLYIDDFHAGDRIFLQGLARVLARSPAGASILVHGSGEEAERSLEAEGIFVERAAGVLPVASAREHVLVERAMRRLNQRIVATLTDAVVPAIGVMGDQRRLLQVGGGRVQAGSIDWMLRLLRKGVVAVVGACAVDPISNRAGEVPVADAVVALSGALGGRPNETIFFARSGRGIVADGGRPIEELTFQAAADRAILPDVEGMKTVLEAGLAVRVTEAARASEARRATRITYREGT